MDRSRARFLVGSALVLVATLPALVALLAGVVWAVPSLAASWLAYGSLEPGPPAAEPRQGVTDLHLPWVVAGCLLSTAVMVAAGFALIHSSRPRPTDGG